ncbi:MAG: tyrosine--tRNA ligase [Rhodospirillaceae bacterium TMED8]|nr:tyrosine--tRNA ligase [Magnetovibrio sp.]OUT51437.1 MAG: tyrosine--tRNA ligase [Rhodospirillaceae bacterium TMED8]|tara:strand:- start:1237 stop:2508 length:1272 start_codon:yes stop_codon:yes gene_type:complete
MAQYKSEFVNRLTERGFMHQCTDLNALDSAAAKNPVTAYIGFDCTGPSLHVGSLVSIMLLRLFQKTGHTPIILLGGGTTKVGDPSGKDESRQLLGDSAIEANMSGIKKVFVKYLSFSDEPNVAEIVNNADWLDELHYISFLRDYGRHFSINRMMSFDSVKTRLDREQHLTFLEFNYMILQAYDFLELARRRGCILQMGGSDQWGNIVNGVELGRRIDNAELFGLTTPLITTNSGGKMGKTAAGAIWLSDDMLPVYDYWQFWRNTEDSDVGKFLRLFTELPLEEIARLEALQNAELNEAKKILADAATALCHGKDAAAKSRITAEQTFEQKSVATGLPTIDVSERELESGISAMDLFRRTKLSNSNGETRRLIRGGGARLNDMPLDNEALVLTTADIGEAGVIKLSVGKKRHVLVRSVAKSQNE